MSEGVPLKETGFGECDRRYKFALNTYPALRFWKCPTCEGKTGQRKLSMVIHIDPMNLMLLNYTSRYCLRCDTLIGHRHEIEHLLFETFSERKPEIIGNPYFLIGTVEADFWKDSLKSPKYFEELRQKTHDFKAYEELRMKMAGYFRKDQEPPVMTPPPSKEWVRREQDEHS